MTEDVKTPTPVEAPAPAAVVAPVEVKPVEAPAVAAVEAPVAEPTTTVLGDALKEDKPVDAAPEAPKEEPKEVSPEATQEKAEKKEGQSDEPAPPPAFDEFKLPEGSQANKELIGEFTDFLGQFEVDTKADHAKVQELGQKAVDLYTREVQKAVESVNKGYMQNWENVKTKWKDEFLNDSQIGGNRAQTTLDSALNFIRNFGGTPEEQTEFRQLMDQSGLGNNKALIRVLANAGRALSEGKPLAATTPVTAPRSKVETLYSGKRYIT
jgi:hypothetical protein